MVTSKKEEVVLLAESMRKTNKKWEKPFNSCVVNSSQLLSADRPAAGDVQICAY